VVDEGSAGEDRVEDARHRRPFPRGEATAPPSPLRRTAGEFNPGSARQRRRAIGAGAKL